MQRNASWCCLSTEKDRRCEAGYPQRGKSVFNGGDEKRACVDRTWSLPNWNVRPRGARHRSIPSWRFPSARPHGDLAPFYCLSVAAVQSEGRHLTLRHGPAPQANSDYSHYYPRRAAGRVGGLLRYISPSCCPRSLPLDQSATIRNLCTNPSRMRPWSTPLVHGMPKTLSRICHCHDLQAISIPPVSPARR